MGWPRLERLSAEDERILALEQGAVTGHWGKVLILEGHLEAPRLRAAIEPRLGAAPRLRQRLTILPRGLGRPVWTDDAEFDLTWHVRPAGVPAPLGGADLRRLVAALMEQRLDRRRPLWRLDVAPLADGRTALIWRVHHCMADGFTAMRTGAACVWEEEGTQRPPAARGGGAAPAPRATLIAAAALDRCAQGAREVRSLARELTAVRRVGDALARVRPMAESARRELSPSPAASRFDAPLGRRRAVAWTTLPLGAVRAAAKRVGPTVTLNDAVVALIASGVAAWATQDHSRVLPSLRVRIPVSLHDAAHASASNRDSFIDVDVPLDSVDVVTRLHAINRATAVCKEAHDAETVDRLLRTLGALPFGAHLVALADGPREFALCISNLVGPRGRTSVDGVPLGAMHSVVEVAEHHDLRASVISCGDALSLCLCADADRVHPDAVIHGIEAAWAELAATAAPATT